MRIFLVIFGLLSLLSGVLLAIAGPVAGFLINWSRSTKMEGSDLTFWQHAAAIVAGWGNSYQAFMLEAGPTLFIVFGVSALGLAVFWNQARRIYVDKFGLKLKVEFESWANNPEKYRTEPYVVRRMYYDNGDRKRRLSHCDFFVGVFNDTTDETIERVKVKIAYLVTGGVHTNMDSNLHSKNDEVEVSINPKTAELFKLGIALDQDGEFHGHPKGYDTAAFETMLKDSKSFGIQLMISPRDEKTGAIRVQPTMRNDQEAFVLEISGKNVPATFALFRHDAKERTKITLIKQTSSLKSASKLTRRHFPKRVPHWTKRVLHAAKGKLRNVTRQTS